MGGACHASVAIFHIKTAQIAHIPIRKRFPNVQKEGYNMLIQITVPVCGQVVLHLRPMGIACGGPRHPKTGGVLSLQQAFIWHDSSWGQVWGKESCSRGKTATGTKLACVGSILGGSARASSTATSASSISFKIIACNAPMSSIPLVEAQGIHLCDNLMHILCIIFCWEARWANCCSACWLALAVVDTVIWLW